MDKTSTRNRPRMAVLPLLCRIRLDPRRGFSPSRRNAVRLHAGTIRASADWSQGHSSPRRLPRPALGRVAGFSPLPSQRPCAAKPADLAASFSPAQSRPDRQWHQHDGDAIARSFRLVRAVAAARLEPKHGHRRSSGTSAGPSAGGKTGRVEPGRDEYLRRRIAGIVPAVPPAPSDEPQHFRHALQRSATPLAHTVAGRVGVAGATPQPGCEPVAPFERMGDPTGFSRGSEFANTLSARHLSGRRRLRRANGGAAPDEPDQSRYARQHARSRRVRCAGELPPSGFAHRIGSPLRQHLRYRRQSISGVSLPDALDRAGIGSQRHRRPRFESVGHCSQSRPVTEPESRGQFYRRGSPPRPGVLEEPGPAENARVVRESARRYRREGVSSIAPSDSTDHLGSERQSYRQGRGRVLGGRVHLAAPAAPGSARTSSPIRRKVCCASGTATPCSCE